MNRTIVTLTLVAALGSLARAAGPRPRAPAHRAARGRAAAQAEPPDPAALDARARRPGAHPGG